MNLESKTAIITGASSGVGFAFTSALVNNGVTVYGLARNFDAQKKLQSRLVAKKAKTLDNNNRRFMLKLDFREIYEKLFQILRKYEFPQNRAHLIAQTHTQSSCDGVYSHGLNRFPLFIFPLFIDYVERGLIEVAAEPKEVGSFGALERWDEYKC